MTVTKGRFLAKGRMGRARYRSGPSRNCSASRHVCSTPESDRESGLPQTGMSALPPKADMCSARGNVR
jgi:hypothetical protein